MLNDIQVFDLTLPAIKKSAKLSTLLDSKGLNIGKMDILIAGIILANGYCEILKKKTDRFDRKVKI